MLGRGFVRALISTSYVLIYKEIMSSKVDVVDLGLPSYNGR